MTDRVLTAEDLRGLGYDVTWDYKRETGVQWHEIHEDGQLFCQIDCGVPLRELQRDIEYWLCGVPAPPGPTQYTVSGPDSEAMTRLLRRILTL